MADTLRQRRRGAAAAAADGDPPAPAEAVAAAAPAPAAAAARRWPVTASVHCEPPDCWVLTLRVRARRPAADPSEVGVVVFTVLAFATRFYSLAQPDSIAWDETHFGKFANEYINGRFYFDVHPPLAKMLIALAGALTGYDGQYDFKEPGQAYGDTEYLGMRMFCAFCGACCVPLVFATVMELVRSPAAASLAALLVLCDMSVLTISRFILLDPILMLFIMLSVFRQEKKKKRKKKEEGRRQKERKKKRKNE